MTVTNLSVAAWRKSSHSGAEHNCVEVARLDGWRAVRDSKNPYAGALAFNVSAWRGLLTDIKQGQHDLSRMLRDGCHDRT